MGCGVKKTVLTLLLLTLSLNATEILWDGSTSVSEKEYREAIKEYVDKKYPKRARVYELQKVRLGQELSQSIDKGSYIQPSLVLIEAGSFIMGSDKGANDEKPTHKVTIKKDFYIGKYEVSVKEFRKFIKDTHHITDTQNRGCNVLKDTNWVRKSDANWDNPYFSQMENSPVVCVSWNDTKAYTKWLSKKTGKRYRLPTESEWEFVARAGRDSEYSFGDNSDNFCSYGNGADQNANSEIKKTYKNKKWRLLDCSDGYGYTSPVGSFKPNKWGVHDMYGNVWEWTEDWYADNYNNTPTDGSINKTGEQEYRVLRGGSWGSNSDGLRSAIRIRVFPLNTFNVAGFRLLQEL